MRGRIWLGALALLGGLTLPLANTTDVSSVTAAVEWRVERARAAGDADRIERVALYVAEPLSGAVVEHLGARGIAVVPGVFVPPMAGRHEHGFHIARLPLSLVDTLRDVPGIVRVLSLEERSRPLDTAALRETRASEVQDGQGVASLLGRGVPVALADSGFDLAHPDLPAPVEAYDVTDGEGVLAWSTDVANLVTDHGTHVAGIVAGSGALSAANIDNGGGPYRGVAPGSALHLYKIGNDDDAEAAWADEIEAIERARALGVKIYVSSYGGYSSYMDGSSAVCQTMDAAAAAGMAIVVAAGNRANDAAHVSLHLAPGRVSDTIRLAVTAPAEGIALQEEIRVIWRDDAPLERNVVLESAGFGAGETLTEFFDGRSPRGSEGRRYVLEAILGPSQTRVFELRARNTALSGATPLVHLYRVEGIGRFENADPAYTVSHPALCDGAIAVGAWTHRRSWTAWTGVPYRFDSLVEGTVAEYSGRGPRLDGRAKPEIVAPGAATISLRDGNVPTVESRRIDNDGLAVDGTGPADYLVRQGTSMAAPHLGGIAALVAEARPGAVATGLRRALIETASQADAPDARAGRGLVDALAAVSALPDALVDGDGDGASAAGEDCDDAVAAVWGTPPALGATRFDDAVTFAWDDAAEPGASTWGFDVVRSPAADDLTAAAICLETNDARDRVAYDTDRPAPGSAFFYVVRVRNGCPGEAGLGSWGAGRTARSCP